jgi:hypothetical protein
VQSEVDASPLSRTFPPAIRRVRRTRVRRPEDVLPVEKFKAERTQVRVAVLFHRQYGAPVGREYSRFFGMNWPPSQEGSKNPVNGYADGI